MQNFNIRDIQLKSLEMLLYFKDFCEKHNLLFYLCGGCCIGTLRHGGFIPWDDDVDVFMPRGDYEKLNELWDKHADTERYSRCRSNKKINYRNLFTVISDNNTTFIRPHQADLDIEHGIALDILPLDGCPKGIKRRFQIFWALLYSIYNAQIVPRNHGKAVTFLGKFLLCIIPFKSMRYRLWRFAEKKMTKYKISDCENITELCSGPVYMRNVLPKKAFESVVYKNFEGHEMPLPVRYHDYLSIVFGDYMTPPPKEKQVAHHDVVFCDLDNSYRLYKGKYYCVEKSKK